MKWIKSSILYLAAYCFFMLIYMLAVVAANLLSVQPGQGSLVTSFVPYFTSAVAGVIGAGLGLYGVARFFSPTVQCRTIFWIHFIVIIFIQILYQILHMIRKILITIFCLNIHILRANELEKGMFALEMEDYDRALYYLSFEAASGNPVAQYNLGLMYKNGVGVKKDLNEAIGWFIIASDNGHMLAKYALGLSYYRGNGLSKNYQKAMNLFLDASYLGHPASQINVGNMYYYGQSVGKNYPKAHMWWSIAKEKGIEAAFNNLTMIENVMSKSQLSEADKLYNFCQKTNIMGLFCTQLHSIPLWLFGQKVDLTHIFWRFTARKIN